MEGLCDGFDLRLTHTGSGEGYRTLVVAGRRGHDRRRSARVEVVTMGLMRWDDMTYRHSTSRGFNLVLDRFANDASSIPFT